MTWSKITCCALVLFGVLAGSAQLRAEDEETSTEPQTITGTLIDKGEIWIEVRADDQQEAVRYTPQWIGGMPRDGGGLDKGMLATIKELKVGSRVQMEWMYEERPRVLKIEVLAATPE